MGELDLLRALLTPFFGSGSYVIAYDSRSLELGEIDYHRVTLDMSWQQTVVANSVVTGYRRCAALRANPKLVPLHVGHWLDLLVNTWKIPLGWGKSGHITFDGITIYRSDGALVVPCLRLFEGERSWWHDIDVLAERAGASRSAVICQG